MTSVLLADLGGTNLRLAKVGLSELSQPRLSAIEQVQRFQDQCDDPYQYFQRCAAGFSGVSHALIAVAGPVINQQAYVPARQWRFNAETMKQALKVESLLLVNDFPAQAMAVPALAATEIDSIFNDWFDPQRLALPTLVCGPGTGLGVAILHPSPGAGGHYFPVATEAGHAHFTALTDFDWGVQQYFARQFGRVSWERVLSGPGLEQLYLAWHQQQGLHVSAKSAEAISKAAGEGLPAALAVIDYFWSLLGRFIGDMVMVHGVGSVMLAGGVTHHLFPYFKAEAFRQSMTDKGRFAEYVSRVPVAIHRCPDPGLLGAMSLAREVFTQ